MVHSLAGENSETHGSLQPPYAPSPFLGWERKSPSPLLVISPADRSQQRWETAKPGLSPLPAAPRSQRGWWGELLRPLLPRSPQQSAVPEGTAGSGRAGEPTLCSALGWPAQQDHPAAQTQRPDNAVKAVEEYQQELPFGQRCYAPRWEITSYFRQDLSIGI